MIYVGIDVAKNKHDCFITNPEGEVLFKPFPIPNNREGFESLFQRIESVSDDLTKVKVGLEATGHYSYNLLRFLLDKSLTTYVINPLNTNLYRKSLSLRKTKYVCYWDKTFGSYLAKKRAEGKHYTVALSHATKKLVRTIYAMEKSG